MDPQRHLHLLIHLIFYYYLHQARAEVFQPEEATLQYYTSLRIGEAAGLAMSDITLGPEPINNTVMIRRSVKWDRVKDAKPYIDNNFKNSAAVGIKSRVLHPEVTNYLKKLLPCIQGEQLFTIDGELLTYRQIQYKYNEALKSAIKFVSFVVRLGFALALIGCHKL